MADRIPNPKVNVGPQGPESEVAAGLRNPGLGGLPGRSGPPGNLNARKHGASRVRADLKELKRRSLDQRTTEARFVAENRGELVSSLGGEENISAQESWLVDAAAFLRLQLQHIDAFLATQPLINRRKKQLYPIVIQRTTLVTALRGLLSDLGLKRRARDGGTLDAYLAHKAATPADNGVGGTTEKEEA